MEVGPEGATNPDPLSASKVLVKGPKKVFISVANIYLTCLFVCFGAAGIIVITKECAEHSHVLRTWQNWPN